MRCKCEALSKWIDDHARLIFVIPAVVVIFILMVFPIVFNIYLSLHRWFLGGIGSYVGLRNYAKLFTSDSRFINSLMVTAKLVVPSVVLSVALGLVMALIISREFKARGFVRTILLLPMLTTPAAMAVVWMIMYNPTLGVMNYLLSLIGVEPKLWVNSTASVLPSLILIEVWKWFPLPMIIILAALQSLPISPYEAAMIDGATKWQVFRYITFPLIRPALITATILRTIDALKAFDIIYVMTQGGPDIASETLEIYTFKTGFTYFELGYSSTLAIVLTIIIMSVSWILSKARERSWSY